MTSREELLAEALKICRLEIVRQHDKYSSDEDVAPYEALLAQIDAALTDTGVAQSTWHPIATALKNARVTGEQRTIFVARFGIEEFPSFNTVYFDMMQGGSSHPWCFADGGGAYQLEWPTHWMFADDAAPSPLSSTQRGQTMEEAAANNFGLTIDDLDEDDE